MGEEGFTFGEIPVEGHISGDVLPGVDGDVSGAHTVHRGLKKKNDERRHRQRAVNMLFVLSVISLNLIISSTQRLPPPASLFRGQVMLSTYLGL